MAEGSTSMTSIYNNMIEQNSGVEIVLAEGLPRFEDLLSEIMSCWIGGADHMLYMAPSEETGETRRQ
jgi:hypothetical protein